MKKHFYRVGKTPPSALCLLFHLSSFDALSLSSHLLIVSSYNFNSHQNSEVTSYENGQEVILSSSFFDWETNSIYAKKKDDDEEERFPIGNKSKSNLIEFRRMKNPYQEDVEDMQRNWNKNLFGTKLSLLTLWEKKTIFFQKLKKVIITSKKCQTNKNLDQHFITKNQVKTSIFVTKQNGLAFQVIVYWN